MTWRDHLERQAASGKSFAGFCRTEDISQANVYAWCTKMSCGAIGFPVSSADSTFIDFGAVARSAADPGATHLPTAATATVTSAPTPLAAVNSSIKLRIDLSGGFVLTITRR